MEDLRAAALGVDRVSVRPLAWLKTLSVADLNDVLLRLDSSLPVEQRLALLEMIIAETGGLYDASRRRLEALLHDGVLLTD